MKKLFVLLSVIFLCFGLFGNANAIPMLSLSSGGASVVVTDGGAGDMSGGTTPDGSVVFIGPVGIAYASLNNEFMKKIWTVASDKNCKSLGKAMKEALAYNKYYIMNYLGDPALNINTTE